MTTQPKVVAICPTADRQALTDRAVRCFERQDYENAQLLILDNGAIQWEPRDVGCSKRRIYRHISKAPIGTLRNQAVDIAQKHGAEIIVHLDSDDVSDPARISTQVRQLVDSKAAAVGYREMLFWESGFYSDSEAKIVHTGEAWLYSNTDTRYIIGTSLCYWVEAWEAAGGFADCRQGEDNDFLKRLRAAGRETIGLQPWKLEPPLIVAEVHGGNATKGHFSPNGRNTDASPQWRRVPDLDARVRELMESA